MKLRKNPETVREMLDWGMISYKTFKHVESMTFEEAKSYCDNLGLYQTWSFPAEHVIEFLKAQDNLPTARFELVRMVMIATGGQINPCVVDEIVSDFIQ